MKSNSIQGFILVGGASRRMGKDKSSLMLGSDLMIDFIARAMSSVALNVRYVTSREREQSWRQQAVFDEFDNWGALGGLHAALNACETEWAMVVACDLPCVTAGLFEFLKSCRSQNEAVVPIQPDGRYQPLCALYKIDPCRDVAKQLILENERRPRTLANRVKARFVQFDEIRQLDGSEFFFSNINTPEDYAEIERIVKGAPSKSLQTGREITGF